jgi:hypothetical protein
VLVPLSGESQQSYMGASALSELKLRLRQDVQEARRYFDDCPAEARKNLSSKMQSNLASAKDAARSSTEGGVTLPESEVQKNGSGGLLRKRDSWSEAKANNHRAKAR